MDDRKRSDPIMPRQNGQGDHEGVPHKPEEFDTMNPAKIKRPTTDETPSNDDTASKS